MAKVTPNSALILALTGGIGDFIFYRDAEGNLTARRRGERRAPPSVKQVANNDRFKLAAIYGNQVKTDPVLVEFYRPFCRGRMQPYHAGVRDYLTLPSVAAIDLQSFTGQPGQLIRVIATDDTRVVALQLAIRHATTAAVFEQGPAELSTISKQWVYTTKTAIPSGTPLVVEATATDRPGNTGTAKVQFFVG